MEISELLHPLREFRRLRAAQRHSAALLVLYFFLAMVAVSLVKSLQNAIYLGNVGFDWRLPALYLALAVLSGPVVLLYRHLALGFSHFLISGATILALGVGLGVFWIPATADGTPDWVFQAFYIWGAFFSVLLPTQGWISSYHLFSPRTAKHVFVLLGTGGVLGGVAGGYYTALSAEWFGVQGLFAHIVSILVVLELVLFLIFRLAGSAAPDSPPVSRDPSQTGASDGAETFRTVFRSRHLKHMAILILLTGLVSTLIDLQYKWVLDVQFGGSEEQITQFFGALLGTTYLLSALLQLFATSWILRRFGLGVALLILPAGLAFASLGIAATAAFWSVIAAKIVDGSLRSSVEQTGVELLYVPIEHRQTIPLKSFMEMAVLRLGDGLGAALFLGIAALSIEPLRLVGLLVLVAVLVWIVAARRVTEEYLLMLRRSLETADARAVRKALELDEAVAEGTLVAALGSPHPGKVLFALQRLGQKEPEVDFSEITSSELSGEILSMDVSSIYRIRPSPPRWLRHVRDLTEHADSRVAAISLHLMLAHQVGGYRRKLRSVLHSERLPAPGYLVYVARYADNPAKLLDPALVLRWCASVRPSEAAALAPVLGTTRDPRYLPILRQWMKGETRALRCAAILAIGRFRQEEDIDPLIEHLSHNWSRRAAIRALAEYGDSLLGKVLSLLRDSAVDVRIKRELPNILVLIDNSSARGLLVASLYTHDSLVAFRALKGLNKMRERHSSLSYSQDSFLPLLQIWGKEYYGLLNMRVLLRGRQGAACRLLRKVIAERLTWNIEKIFRGLNLFLPMGDAYLSYLGFTGSRLDLRENAVELIDSRIRGELRQTLLPIFAETEDLEIVRKGREIFQLPSDPEAALSEAFFQADPWLKCCTIGAAMAERMEGLKEKVRLACGDINPLVRDTARWALAEWEKGKAGSQL
jgi:ATP:ADP antiporter, AAA family